MVSLVTRDLLDDVLLSRDAALGLSDRHEAHASKLDELVLRVRVAVALPHDGVGVRDPRVVAEEVLKLEGNPLYVQSKKSLRGPATCKTLPRDRRVFVRGAWAQFGTDYMQIAPL
jgi:hypothetical protein